MAAPRARSGAPYGSSNNRRTTGDILNDIVAVIGRVAAVVFLLALAYTLYAVFGGGLKEYPSGFTIPLALRLRHNVDLAFQVLAASAAIVTLSFTILMWGWDFGWPILLVAGALFYYGLPYLGVPQMARAAITGPYHPGAVLLQAWRAVGAIFLGASALFFLGWSWDQLQRSLNARRRVGGLKVPFYSACWQTHYCKDEINRLCEPGRKGYRKSCWRYKSGCFCDESIGDKVLSSARQAMGADAAKWLGPQARPPAPTFADRLRSPRHRATGQRIACGDCPLYSYHQVQKHRILTPVVLVGVPALVFFYIGQLHAAYGAMVGRLDRFALHLAFNPQSTAALQGQIHGALGEPLVEYLIYILLAVLLITAAARTLEWWCFEAKL